MSTLAAAGLVLGLAAGPDALRAGEVGGVRFADRLEAGDAALELRGLALLRWRWILDVYVAALYLGEGVALERVLDDAPRRLEIEYFRGFTAEQFAGSTVDGIGRNVDADALTRLRPAIARFNRFYRDVEAGDRYALTYVPGEGTALELNGRRLGSEPGGAFARAIFSIWLGEAPIDAGLKRDLLDGS